MLGPQPFPLRVGAQTEALAWTWRVFMKVLVVDNDTAVREALMDLLLLEGFAPRGAANAEAAISALAQEPVDLIISDTFSPIWGDEALAPVRQLVEIANGTPVILATAHAQAADLDPEEVGLADVIIKPFDVDELVARLQSLVEESQA
jgi:DNA-binding response OmpR family regulator